MREPSADIFGIVGSTVANTYAVESVVAEGGFAVVYRARHTGFSAPVALKCLKLSERLGPERHAAFLAQFRSEAELMFQLASSIPNIVRPLHVDALTTPDGTFVPFLVLEWLQGETLEAYVERRVGEGRGPPALKKLVRLLTPVARALERAHNFQGPTGTLSIIHRDLKPENIFVADVAGEQVVKILDFGVARADKVASQVGGQSSSEPPSFLTPAYAAPEQWLPKRYGQTGPWTDVWGLALTLVEAAKGVRVLDGDVQTMMRRALDKHQRPTPRAHGIEVPDAVERLFEHALALDPRDRPASIGLFWDELSSALGLKLEDRHRDLRSEGLVLREERIEPARRPFPRGAAVPHITPASDPVTGDESRTRLRAEARVDPDSSARIAIARRLCPDSSSHLPIAREEPEPVPPPDEAPLEVAPLPERVELDVQLAPRAGHSAPRFGPVPSAPLEQPAAGPRLGLGAGLIVAGIALALVSRASGGIRIGPIEATLVAGLFVLLGVGVIAVRLLPRDRA